MIAKYRLTNKELDVVLDITILEVVGKNVGGGKNIEGITSNVKAFLREYGEEMTKHIAAKFAKKKKGEEASGARASDMRNRATAKFERGLSGRTWYLRGEFYEGVGQYLATLFSKRSGS